MTAFANPILAIAIGAFLICAETCLHFESLLALPRSWLDLPIHDWAAGSFLIYAGVRSGRRGAARRVYQVAAWAFTASLLCGAFFAHLEDWQTASSAENWLSPRAFVLIIGLLFAISLCALLSTIRLALVPERVADASP